MDATTSDLRNLQRRSWRPDGCERVALVLQGGGALGAYQAGVYQALHEAEIEPDWVSGVSIGAINSAIIAGNSRRRRLDRLRAFWDLITERKIWHYTPDGDAFRKQLRQFLDHHDPGPARVLHTAPSHPVAQPSGLADRNELLRQLSPSRDARRPRRFLYDQREGCPLLGRRSQRAKRQFRLLRQRDRGDWARACDGKWRTASSAAHDQDRYRSLLGRRHRLQHAAPAHSRPGRPRQYAHLPDR